MRDEQWFHGVVEKAINGICETTKEKGIEVERVVLDETTYFEWIVWKSMVFLSWLVEHDVLVRCLKPSTCYLLVLCLTAPI